MNRFIQIIYFSILLLCFSPLFLVSQENSAKAVDSIKTEVKIPQLAGHYFVQSNHIRSPFIQTYIRNSLGVGQAYDLDISLIEIDGDPALGLQGDLMYVGLEMEYQYAVKQWLAMWLKFGIAGRLGSETQSLLAQGVNAAVEIEFGWMFRLRQTKNTLLSGTIHIMNNNGTFVDLIGYLNRIIEEGEISPDNLLVKKRPYLRGGGGLRFAWAISEFFGLHLLTETAYGESIDTKEKNRFYYKAGASVDLNLNYTKDIPLGFVLGYFFDTFPSGGDVTLDYNYQAITLRIAYTGRPDFLLSLDNTWSWFPQRDLDQTLTGGMMLVNMRYYF